MRDWKMRHQTAMVEMQNWKMRHQYAGLENAGLENGGYDIVWNTNLKYFSKYCSLYQYLNTV